MDITQSNDLHPAQESVDLSSSEYQLSLIKKGTNYAKLLRACVVDDGILKLGKAKRLEAVDFYEKQMEQVDIEKFVPASGAATRMFKKVYNWIESPQEHKEEIDSFFAQVEQLACFEDWFQSADLHDIETFEGGLNSKVSWLKLLIDDKALGYGNLPKGLIPFHQYDETARTPVYEHLKEAVSYAKGKDGCKVHFTVSPAHLEGFKQRVPALLNESEFSNENIAVSYSSQMEQTDTVAADQHFNVIEVDGKELRRPGGHGALIHNLNNLTSELVFIKNIDNVCTERLRSTTIEYKKVIAGVLFMLRSDLELLFKHMKKGLIDEQEIQELREKWKIRIPKDYKGLQQFLKRPIRVCGMVKNQGEPGGGPFWCIDPILGESTQIVEQAQINMNDYRQKAIARHASHFNPVDLVCFLKDFEGNQIDLLQYVDHDSYFIADKSFEGDAIRALEWPGLWNGAMAHWITLFVEVPIETFNPVKEFKDLLRSTHLE